MLVDAVVGLFFLLPGGFNEAGPRHFFLDPDEGRFVLLFFRLLALHTSMVASPHKGMQSHLAQCLSGDMHRYQMPAMRARTANGPGCQPPVGS
jgi:hypothetical protein